MMRVQFVAVAMPRTVCGAEVVFDEGTPLAGMKLTGFLIKQPREGGSPYVSFPSRAYGVGAGRGYLSYLAPVSSSDPTLDMQTVHKVKQWILSEYAKQGKPFNA